ncbi:hypothetical protein A3F06_04360 [candidate division TM6 bacterium RIFCSPHIGHO2_12_FULL_36_22]|nr:MAG: hypothetical protein A3F06_04360 [candidate division TM6 bacterium RIFCSPHIGHO2_12_FULL_36_22]
MKKLIFFLLFLTFSLRPLDSMRCCYPVAAVTQGGQSRIFYLDQQSLQCLQLWVVDSDSKDSNKALLFIYNPSSISLLPSGKGFGFIDRGRIKMKTFIKKSPHSLDFYEPIYNITRAHWIDDEHCYFSAKQDNRYKLFMSNLDSDLSVLVDIPNVDIIYPSHIAVTIYYLSKDVTEGVSLCCIDTISGHVATIVSLGRKNIAFLEMKSHSEGFFIQAPFSIDTQANNLELVYYRVYKEGEWKQEKLFSFIIPIHYLFGKGPERFYESLMAFLPRIYEDEIFFSSLSVSHLDCYSYNRKARKVRPLFTDVIDTDRFGALRHEGRIYCGHAIRSESDYDVLPNL